MQPTKGLGAVAAQALRAKTRQRFIQYESVEEFTMEFYVSTALTKNNCKERVFLKKLFGCGAHYLSLQKNPMSDRSAGRWVFSLEEFHIEKQKVIQGLNLLFFHQTRFECFGDHRVQHKLRWNNL